ncbi:hypothetical protein BB560_005227 [Smittium megazygosporum]|uniref:Exportin-2 C-terminal domain-containing protein n=1 Tax=Smittium megazygosporum TaxID=133381 RepID=A0A2T9Z731_9FUNG|nr:hypothetical protein BB560_005227 [Smittium megazygosporum]
MVKNPRYKSTFESNNMISIICEKIVLKNIELSTTEEELFEDEPINYVRRELEGTEAETRRNAASNLVHGLLYHFGQATTQAMLGFIMAKLDHYSQNPSANWKSKDTAQFMVTSISAVASVKSLGVTQTNQLVNLTDFYNTQMHPHLVNLNSDSNCPILKSNAIKYLYVFRNQLPESQLLEVFPSLVAHLVHPSVAVSTFSAIVLERFLVLKKNNVLVFDEPKVSPYAQSILEKLFGLILSNSSPEKLSENDFYAKLIMRTILSCRNGIPNLAPVLFDKLTLILKNICINPSNPLFSHFLFESVASLSRFTCSSDPSAVTFIENGLFPQFQIILENEISDFMPYTFQILSLLLSLHKNESQLSSVYISLLQPILQPVLWEYQGNIPALTNLLQSYFSVNGQQIAENGQLEPVLGIFQKLIVSKMNDQYAFSLLSSIVLYVPLRFLENYLKPIFILVLNRLQSKKTPKFVRLFTQFVGFFCSIDVNLPKTPNSTENRYIYKFLKTFEEIQPQLFLSLLTNVLVQAIPVVSGPNEIKYTTIGFTSLICSKEFSNLKAPESIASSVISQIIKLLEDHSLKLKNKEYSESGLESENKLIELDFDEAVYQSSFSKLSTLENIKLDPCARITEPRQFVGYELSSKINSGNTFIQNAISQISESDKNFIQAYLQLN